MTDTQSKSESTRDDVLTYAAYELATRRAAYQVRLRYNINRYELRMLMQLCGILAEINKPFISRQVFFSQVTGNSREWRKMHGYYMGLVRGKFIGTFEWVGRKGSTSVGISELGLVVCEAYADELARLRGQYKVSSGLPAGRVVSYESYTGGRYFAKAVA